MENNKDTIVLPMGTFRRDPENPTRWIEVPRDDGFNTWLERAWTNAPSDFSKKH